MNLCSLSVFKCQSITGGGSLGCWAVFEEDTGPLWLCIGGEETRLLWLCIGSDSLISCGFGRIGRAGEKS
jgi:hypothetical protein